jgi:hypothetical protein
MGSSLIHSISSSIGRQCKPGTIVITTDYMLPLQGTVPPVENDARVHSGPFQLELLEQINGIREMEAGIFHIKITKRMYLSPPSGQ